MNPTLYHLPVLSKHDFGLFRSPGAGLGNLLFPIARAISGQTQHGGNLVYPTLRQFKVGTFARRELDSRTYGDVFRSRSYSEWADWVKVKSKNRIVESDFRGDSVGETVVTYRGLGKYFHDLQQHRAPISNWITTNARTSGLIEAEYDIGIHVRLGDFQDTDTSGNGHSIKQSFEWYRSAHEHALKQLGLRRARTVLFTDEQPDKVASALEIPDLELDPSNNAITAILNLARARTIVTSRSTFSMWAVYLGGSHALWDKRMDLSKSLPFRTGLDYQI